MISEKKLADYGMKTIDENWEPLGKDIYIYSMDGYPHNRFENSDECAKYNMASHVGLPSCHCCDCFIFMKDAISLIEETELLKTKNEIDPILKNIPHKHKYDLSIKLITEYIIRDSISKMYGSMLVLCKFSHYCEIMKNHIGFCNGKKYEFWLVIPVFEEQDVKGMEAIKLELDLIIAKLEENGNMANRLKSVAGNKKGNKGNKVNKVKILYYKHLNEEIRKKAVPV